MFFILPKWGAKPPILLIILEGAHHWSLLLIAPKDRLLENEGLLNKLLPLVENDDLLLSSLNYRSVQVEVFIVLHRVKMSTRLHEVHVDVNIHCLRILALLTIDYAWVFVAAQVMHQFVLPFKELIIWIGKLVINILTRVLLVLHHQSQWRTLHTIQCESFL